MNYEELDYFIFKIQKKIPSWSGFSGSEEILNDSNQRFRSNSLNAVKSSETWKIRNCWLFLKLNWRNFEQKLFKKFKYE